MLWEVGRVCSLAVVWACLWLVFVWDLQERVPLLCVLVQAYWWLCVGVGLGGKYSGFPLVVWLHAPLLLQLIMIVGLCSWVVSGHYDFYCEALFWWKSLEQGCSVNVAVIVSISWEMWFLVSSCGCILQSCIFDQLDHLVGMAVMPNQWQ